MNIVLGEQGITTNFVELEIKNQPKLDLNDKNLNLYHEKM